MHIEKRHPRVFALLVLCALALSAPYLMPGNPDSPVFRSGVLPAVLIICLLPLIERAVRQATPKSLLACLPFSLALAFAISLGAELAAYSHLLPGLSSLLRRLLVPLLTLPTLLLLTDQVTRLRLKPSSPSGLSHPFPVFAVILWVCWLPTLLAYFPGMLNYDFPGEYAQHLKGAYSALHPLGHSVLMNGIITLGEHLHSRTFGVLLMSLLQGTVLSLTLSRGLTMALSRSRSLPATLLALLFFALHPVFSVLAFSMTKDTLFAAACANVVLSLWQLAETPSLLNRPAFSLVLAAHVLAACTMRVNGPLILLAVIPGILVLGKSSLRSALFLAAGIPLTALVLHLSLTAWLSPAPAPDFQLYSIPAQQLVRAYRLAPLDEKTRSEIRSWYVSEEGLNLYPHIADPAKGYLDAERLSAHRSDFFSLVGRVIRADPRCALEAFLLLNIGSWYPDDTSYASVYSEVAAYLNKGYLQTQETDMSADGIHTRCLFPLYRQLTERICRGNALQKLPLLSLLVAPSLPFWGMCLLFLLLRRRGYGRRILSPALLLVLWVSYLLGPCTLVRYLLPLYCVVPPLLIIAFSLPDSALPSRYDKSTGEF